MHAQHHTTHLDRPIAEPQGHHFAIRAHTQCSDFTGEAREIRDNAVALGLVHPRQVSPRHVVNHRMPTDTCSSHVGFSRRPGCACGHQGLLGGGGCIVGPGGCHESLRALLRVVWCDVTIRIQLWQLTRVDHIGCGSLPLLRSLQCLLCTFFALARQLPSPCSQHPVIELRQLQTELLLGSFGRSR